ncbi:alpha/beta-hydrolase [Fomitopsis betulina]|nr:alpha/beta-hydrolase [Fomitopsis betulina]
MRLFLLGVLALAELIAAADHSTPVIDLGYAQYQGSFDSSSNVSHFFGIRYAQPPTDDLRWRAPQTPTTTAGVQQATEQPNQCYQSNNGISSTNPYRTSSSIEKRAVSEDEDCLFLNVYTPGELSPGAKLPVLVWIHGGGYIAGAASSFSGEDIIKESGFGVVAVFIQYRLGVLGFLPGSEVQANGTLNAGLLDQNFALQWVQEHIASFGGDPTKVTIWGESAGAGSVIQHIVAHGGHTEPPLFRAAMTSSTFLPFQYYYNDTIPEALFSETVAQTNCSSASDALACLRAADVSTLQAANTNINIAGFYGTFVFVPVIDGTFIVERPTVTLEKRRVNGDMLLSVTNSYEGYTFVDTANPPTNLTNYVAELFPLIDPITIQTIVQQYEDVPTLPDVLSQAVAVMGESMFICPTYLLMEAFGVNAFKGEFAVPPAHHGEDLDYYFPTAFPPAYNNSELITAFSQSFLSVVRSLTPNDKFYTDLKPEWSIWQDGTTEMLFNVTSAGGAVVQTTTTDPSLLERCALWQSLSSQTYQ